jgi:hypothetical protein
VTIWPKISNKGILKTAIFFKSHKIVHYRRLWLQKSNSPTVLYWFTWFIVLLCTSTLCENLMRTRMRSYTSENFEQKNFEQKNNWRFLSNSFGSWYSTFDLHTGLGRIWFTITNKRSSWQLKWLGVLPFISLTEIDNVWDG